MNAKKKTSPNTLLIRVDANSTIGLGHFMRCWGLAQAWRRKGGDILLVMKGASDALIYKAVEAGFRIELVNDLSDEVSYLELVAKQNSVMWIVIDGYQFDSAYIKAIKECGFRIFVIDDDGGLPAYPADIILNQNHHADLGLYKNKTDAQILIGNSYVLIRQEIFEKRGWRRNFQKVGDKVLVTFGGADPDNKTSNFIKSFIAEKLASLSNMRIRIIIGGENPHDCTIQNIVKDIANIETYFNVLDMGEHIRWCDVAVSGAGSTVWELALCQTPMLLIPNSYIERQVADKMAEIKSCISFMDINGTGFRSLIEVLIKLQKKKFLREHLGQNAGKIIDGEGADRVVDVLLNYSK
jgi:UDP-2,4-diacetamido-2,4,6-trideoxy-beta-L-altropyranose hydrolase